MSLCEKRQYLIAINEDTTPSGYLSLGKRIIMDSYSPQSDEYSYRLHAKSGERTVTEKSSSRVMKSCCVLLIAVLTAWNIALHVQTSRHSQKIQQLELKYLQRSVRSMDTHRVSEHHRVGRSVPNSEARAAEFDLNAASGNIDELVSAPPALNSAASDMTRDKRAARGRNKERQRKHTKRDKKQTKGSKNSGPGAHFVAYVDDEKLTRQIVEGVEPRIGRRDANGALLPSDHIYRFWKPASWSSNRKFVFDEETGKVTVKATGFYLVYGQIVFHGPAARKSYGIHINDEDKPFVESIAFDNIREVRTKRDVSSLDQRTGNSTVTEHLLGHLPGHRHKRSGQYSSYSQCNTVAVTYLEQNSTVFLKSLRLDRSIITEPYLTFWGIAKL